MRSGVLPPVSILTRNKCSITLLSGFTAKLAGTGVESQNRRRPSRPASGKAFLELHPTKYAEELVKRAKQNNSRAYLVNTGWNGSGKRISIRDTRGIIDAILNGSIAKAPTKSCLTF